MQPVEFPEATSKLLGTGIPNCGDLPVWKDGQEIISKWKMSWRERLSALVFGTVFVRVVAPKTAPPIAFHVMRQIFDTTEPVRIEPS